MSGKELLELAAKASGRVIEWVDNEPMVPYPEEYRRKTRIDGYEWNPRTDDGDSRRLQMELGLSLSVMTSFLVASTRLCDGTWIQAREDFNADGDACDSARLAVLRVAADIGRRMP